MWQFFFNLVFFSVSFVHLQKLHNTDCGSHTQLNDNDTLTDACVCASWNVYFANSRRPRITEHLSRTKRAERLTNTHEQTHTHNTFTTYSIHTTNTTLEVRRMTHKNHNAWLPDTNHQTYYTHFLSNWINGSEDCSSILEMIRIIHNTVFLTICVAQRTVMLRTLARKLIAAR